MAEHEVNVQKSIALLYTKDKEVEFEIKDTIPFTLAYKTMKYLSINLTKIYKICMRKTRKL